VKKMKKAALFFLLALFSLFFLMGCYGIQQGQCPSFYDTSVHPIDKMDCYYRAAIGYAYAADKTGVMVYCDMIDQLGQQYGKNIGNKDFEKTAETMKNRCYYDSAIIMAQDDKSAAESLCNEITERQNVFGLKTASITQETCFEQVEKLAAVSPKNYYSNQSNICNLLFVFIGPLAIFLFYRAIHKL